MPINQDIIVRYFMLGGIAFLTGITLYSTWNYLGDKVALRIKHDYFERILEQEQLFFDKQNTFEYATKVQSQISNMQSAVSY